MTVARRSRLSSSLLVAATLFGTACAAPNPVRPSAPSVPPAASAPARPKLVVLVVVDQLPSWSFGAQERLMTQGFARLLREAVYFPTAEVPYAATLTSPGHAAIVTGAPPRATGILANRWYDRALGKAIESVTTPSGEGYSPERLRVDTVGDALRQTTANAAKVVAVAFKTRSAILLGGHRPTTAVWFDPKRRAMTTNAYYGATPPAWLTAFGDTNPVAARLAATWTPLAPDVVAREAGQPDDAPGESPPAGMGRTFPHALAAAQNPSDALEASPFADELVLETALAALDGEALGTDDVTDLLAISFSSSDEIGHLYGRESWEELDVMLRLDVLLGRLFARLDERLGPDGYALVLTSDHGATRSVEHSRSQGRPALIVDAKQLLTLAQETARQIAGPGDWVISARDPTLYLSEAARSLPPATYDRLLDALVVALGKVDGMGRVLRTDRLFGDCAAQPADLARFCHAIDPKASGELYLAPRPDSVILSPPFEATTHGSPNPDDSFVPVFVRAPGRAPRRDATPVSFLRVAATVADLLGVAPPKTAEGPAL